MIGEHTIGERAGVTRAGAGSSGADPIVLLPGLGGSAADDFAFVLPMLARRHEVLALDFDGPLRADGSLRLGELVSRVEATIAELLPGKRVILVGYSLGAAVATALAATSPAIVSSLVLVAGWLASTERQKLFASVWQRLSIRAVSTRDGEALTDFARLSVLGAASLDSSRGSGSDPAAPFALGRSTDARVQLLASLDLTAAAERIAAPTLVVGCSEDAVAGREQALALFGALPDARYAEIDSGHAVLLERPAELLSLLEGFAGAPLRHPAGSRLERAAV